MSWYWSMLFNFKQSSRPSVSPRNISIRITSGRCSCMLSNNPDPCLRHFTCIPCLASAISTISSRSASSSTTSTFLIIGECSVYPAKMRPDLKIGHWVNFIIENFQDDYNRRGAGARSLCSKLRLCDSAVIQSN